MTLLRKIRRRRGYAGVHRTNSPIRAMGPMIDPWPLAPIEPADNLTGSPALFAATMVIPVYTK